MPTALAGFVALAVVAAAATVLVLAAQAPDALEPAFPKPPEPGTT